MVLCLTVSRRKVVATCSSNSVAACDEHTNHFEKLPLDRVRASAQGNPGSVDSMSQFVFEWPTDDTSDKSFRCGGLPRQSTHERPWQRTRGPMDYGTRAD